MHFDLRKHRLLCTLPSVLVLLTSALVLGSIASTPIEAQSGGLLTFTGTVSTNLGQTIVAGTPIVAVTTSTSITCGQSVVGAASSYTLTITTGTPCNAVGTALIFRVDGVAASPIAFVTTSAGTILLNLTLTGLPSSAINSSTSAGTTGGVLTPPTSPPSGSGSAAGGALVPPLNAGAGATSGGQVVPPTSPPAGSAAQPSASATGATNASTSTSAGQSLSATTHSVAVALTVGCNQAVVAFGQGAQPQQVAAAIVNPAAVLSIWHFDNAGQRYSGYFPTPGVPSDLTALAPVDAVFICVSADTTLNAPQP